jgi:hypothetical protein
VARPVGARCDTGAVEDQCQGPDTDSDGVCDATDVCTNVAGGQNITINPKVTLNKINTDTDPTNDQLKLAGEFVLPVGTNFAALDPLTDGARIIIKTAAGTPNVDITLPGGAYAGSGTRGWRQNGSGTKWTFKDNTGNPVNGITKMLIQDRNAEAPKQVKVLVKGKDGSYPTAAGDIPVGVTVVLGGQSSSEAGQCGEIAFTPQQCSFNGAATKLSCKL